MPKILQMFLPLSLIDMTDWNRENDIKRLFIIFGYQMTWGLFWYDLMDRISWILI